MLIFSIIKEILSINKYWQEIKRIISFFKRSGLFNPLVIIFISVASFGSLFLIKRNLIIDNSEYDNETKNTKINQLANKILNECGNKSGISISTISLEIKKDGIFHEGRFKLVKACDKRVKGCIVDLISVKEAELKAPYDIDPVSYDKLLDIGSGLGFPKAFALKKDGEQNLDSLTIYPSLVNILQKAAPIWYKEKSLNTLYITSILKNKNILWVLTLLTGTDNLNCLNPHQNLYELKEALKNE